MKHFKAPWCISLIVVSALVTILCVGITISAQPWAARHGNEWLAWLPLALVFGCAPFTIRGYTITPDTILVHRLFWATRLPRAGLQSARVDPQAMRWSIRTCGNGGLFSATGFYWNKSLGSYRAYVMNPRRAVVLKFERRTVVVSPDAPEEFVRELGGTVP
ncbi:MAG: PH domain-containing protein [Verrucomicrobiota bacterium]|jgi:hypothetical protein